MQRSKLQTLSVLFCLQHCTVVSGQQIFESSPPRIARTKTIFLALEASSASFNADTS